MNLLEIKKKVNKAEGKKELILSTLEVAKRNYATLCKQQITVDEAQILLQNVAKDTQEHLKFHIQDIVNLAIDSCFPGKYEFTVDFEIKRGQTEAHLGLLKDGTAIDPMNDTGGGIVDVTAFALRIAAWTLSKTDNVILLDEPGKFVSRDLQPQFSRMLKSLSEKLGLQFIVVTHQKEMIDVADVVFEVTQKKGVSKIERKEQ